MSLLRSAVSPIPLLFIFLSLLDEWLQFFHQLLGRWQFVWVKDSQGNSSVFQRSRFCFVRFFPVFVPVHWSVQFHGQHDGKVSSANQEINALTSDFPNLNVLVPGASADVEQLRHAHLGEYVHVVHGVGKALKKLLLGFIQQVEFVSVSRTVALFRFCRPLQWPLFASSLARFRYRNYCRDDK